MTPLPIILLPGLGATEEVFRPQLDALPEATVPEWIAPRPRESLAQYAERFAAAIDPGEPCVLGGLSFGGITATEVARHLDVRALVLIATLAHPDQMPRRARWFGHAFGSLPTFAVAAGQGLARVLAPVARCVTTRKTWSMYRQAWGNPARLLTWSARAMATWEAPSSELTCPVLRIHGSGDWAFPARCAPDAEGVEGGWHVLTLSHPERVTDLLRRASALRTNERGGPRTSPFVGER